MKLYDDIANAVNRYFRKLFIEGWNKKYPSKPWNGNSDSGQDLIIELRQANTIKFSAYEYKLKHGNDQDWQITVWAFILLDSGLELCVHLLKGNLHMLKKKTMSLIQCSPNGSNSSTECEKLIGEMKCIVEKIRLIDARDEISDIVTALDKATDFKKKTKLGKIN